MLIDVYYMHESMLPANLACEAALGAVAPVVIPLDGWLLRKIRFLDAHPFLHR